ncbi:MAG TPA: hypothetical protein PK156_02295 [Polyangium sp.]|nr:hypothetical protein [Polyangium sp.]
MSDNTIVDATSGGGTGGRGKNLGGGDDDKLSWGVVISNRGEDLFDALKPLVVRRVGSEVKDITGAKFVMPDLQQIDKFCKESPEYLLLLGGVDEIPFEVQRELVRRGKRVGRLVFPDVKGYETYANKVVQWERADSDVGCVVVTDPKKSIRFYHKNFTPLQQSPFTTWPSNKDNIHPMQLIQRALAGERCPLPILARVPLQWLKRTPLPADLHANHLDWSILDLEKDDDKNLLPRSFRKALAPKEKRRIGEWWSTNRSGKSISLEFDEDAKLAIPMANLVLGDPAIQLGSIASDSVQTQA